MKKIVSLILLAVFALSLVSCTQVDIDLRDKGNVYNDLVFYINNRKNYEGQTIAFTGIHTVTYNFSENKIVRHYFMTYDAAGEKKALYEIRTADGIYPVMQSTSTVFGTLRSDDNGGYIEVDRFSGAKTEKRSFGVEAIDMSAAELEKFITAYKKSNRNSEYYEKTIRIYGHCDKKEGYNYLLGLDGEGAYTWDIELHDPKGKVSFPKAEGTAVNPVEVIGKLTMYFENNIGYACIEVERVTPIQSIFKAEDEATETK